MVLDIFALIVMAILVAVVIWLVVLLGSLPGKIADERGHRQADAIRALGWIGIITLGVGWFVAIVWAYTNPSPSSAASTELEERIAELEKKLKRAGSEGAEA